jgi:hypothetical protein
LGFIDTQEYEFRGWIEAVINKVTVNVVPHSIICGVSQYFLSPREEPGGFGIEYCTLDAENYELPRTFYPNEVQEAIKLAYKSSEELYRRMMTEGIYVDNPRTHPDFQWREEGTYWLYKDTWRLKEVYCYFPSRGESKRFFFELPN